MPQPSKYWYLTCSTSQNCIYVLDVQLNPFSCIHREHVETLEVDACMVATGRVPNTKNMGLEDRGIVTNRGFVAVNEYMQVMTQADGGEVVPNVYCIGDANGKLMLAHAASAQGISAIENIVGRTHVVNHLAIPAAVRCRKPLNADHHFLCRKV